MKRLRLSPSFRRKPESIVFKKSRYWTPIYTGVTTKKNRFSRTNSGFTLFEVILAILILLVAIVPMLEAFRPAVFGTASEEVNVVFTNQARHTLNRVAATNFSTLNQLVVSNQANPVNLDNLFGATAGQEMFSLNGSSYTPAVAITDASGGKGGLLEISVTVNNHVTLKTLKADY